MDEGFNKSADVLLERAIHCMITVHRIGKEEVKGCAAVYKPLSSLFPVRKIEKQ